MVVESSWDSELGYKQEVPVVVCWGKGWMQLIVHEHEEANLELKERGTERREF